MIASLAWAILLTRRQRDDYERRLTAWTAERAVHHERLRIARDLHDLTSHGLGIITMRAAAANYVEGSDAERRQALRDIERVSRATTDELRRMLALLRRPDDGPAPLCPTDSPTAVPARASDAERAGA